MDIPTKRQVQEAAKQLRLIVDRPAIATQDLTKGTRFARKELTSNLPDGYVAIVDNRNKTTYTRMPLETFKTLLTLYEDQLGRKGEAPKLLKKVMVNGQLFSSNAKFLDIVQRHGQSVPLMVPQEPIQKVKKKVVVKGKQKKLGVKASEKPAPKPKPVKKKKYKFPQLPAGYKWIDLDNEGEVFELKLKGGGYLNYFPEDNLLTDHLYHDHKYSNIESVIEKLEGDDIVIEQEEVELSPEYKRYTYQGVPYFVIMEEGDNFGPYEVLNDDLQLVGEKFHDSAKIHFVNPSLAAEHRRHPKYKPT